MMSAFLPYLLAAALLIAEDRPCPCTIDPARNQPPQASDRAGLLMGHKLQVSSVELERACVEGTSEVMEAAAVGVPSPGGGPDKLVLFLVLQPGSPGGAADTQALRKRCQAAIRERLNPLFRLDKVRPAAQSAFQVHCGLCHRLSALQCC